MENWLPTEGGTKDVLSAHVDHPSSLSALPLTPAMRSGRLKLFLILKTLFETDSRLVVEPEVSSNLNSAIT